MTLNGYYLTNLPDDENDEKTSTFFGKDQLMDVIEEKTTEEKSAKKKLNKEKTAEPSSR